LRNTIFGVNEGRSAGRTIDHLHFHLIPRFKGDVKNPTGGIRSVIPAKGNYKTITKFKSLFLKFYGFLGFGKERILLI